MLPGVDAAVCAASLCAAFPKEEVLPGVVATLSVASLGRVSPSLLVGQIRSLLYVVLVLPHPFPPRLVSLPICLCKVALFFLTLGRVGRRPLLCAQDPQVFLCSFFVLSSQRVSCAAFLSARLGFCFRGISFFRRSCVGACFGAPVIGYGLVCSYPGWILASLAFNVWLLIW